LQRLALRGVERGICFWPDLLDTKKMANSGTVYTIVLGLGKVIPLGCSGITRETTYKGVELNVYDVES